MPAQQCSLTGFGSQSKPFLHMVFLVVSTKCALVGTILRNSIIEWRKQVLRGLSSAIEKMS